MQFKLNELCKAIKEQGFNLRISLNVLGNLKDELVKISDDERLIKVDYDKLFKRFEELCADQVTFRKIWTSGNDTEQDKWIEENILQAKMPLIYEESYTLEEYFFHQLNKYIKQNGCLIGKLTFGALQYSVNQISTVIDDNCMDDQETKEEHKYLILRENGKLYTN